MDEPVKLTKKQQQVLKGLREGKSPQDIAKSIKASRSAVYGHMARLKEKGVALPEHGPNGDAPAASGNGRSANGGATPRPFADGFTLDINEVEERTRAAIEEIDARAHERLKDVQAERLTLQDRLAVLQDEEGQINAAIQRAKKVEEALV
jgi:hypothetical protein